MKYKVFVARQCDLIRHQRLSQKRPQNVSKKVVEVRRPFYGFFYAKKHGSVKAREGSVKGSVKLFFHDRFQAQ